MNTIPEEDYNVILEMVADGATLTDAIRAHGGRPGVSAFMKRCRDDGEFSRAYFFAKTARAEHRQSKYVSVLDRVLNREIDPQSGKVVLNSLRYLMAADDTRMSEKYRAELSGPEGKAIEIERRNTSSLEDLEIARWLGHCLDKQTRAPLLLEASS